MSILLALDLSTNSTGYARFDLATKKLLDFGTINPTFKNPTVKGVTKFKYPAAQLFKMRGLVSDIVASIKEDVSIIVIEEVNRGVSRLGQKTLDALHYLLLDRMKAVDLFKVVYIDSDGRTGWRGRNGLSLLLSDMDKILNKQTRAFNRRLGKAGKHKPVITQKHLACQYVNKQFKMNFDVDANEFDNDMVDAIGLGFFYITKVLK